LRLKFDPHAVAQTSAAVDFGLVDEDVFFLTGDLDKAKPLGRVEPDDFTLHGSFLPQIVLHPKLSLFAGVYHGRDDRTKQTFSPPIFVDIVSLRTVCYTKSHTPSSCWNRHPQRISKGTIKWHTSSPPWDRKTPANWA
jgi:hypothetical protein